MPDSNEPADQKAIRPARYGSAGRKRTEQRASSGAGTKDEGEDEGEDRGEDEDEDESDCDGDCDNAFLKFDYWVERPKVAQLPNRRRTLTL
ncbi:hypothetical protein [Streptomyces sp. NPDC004788]